MRNKAGAGRRRWRWRFGLNPLIANQLELVVVVFVEPLGAFAGAQAAEEGFGFVLDVLAGLPHGEAGGVEVVLVARELERLLPRVLSHEVGQTAVEDPHVVIRKRRGGAVALQGV